MKEMFNNCSSLLSLPDISKWNTSKVTDMSKMFNNCSSISSLPDILKWNTDNVINSVNHIFDNCLLLLYLPDLEQIKKIINSKMQNFFNKYDNYGNIIDDEFGNDDNMNYNFPEINQYTENKFENYFFDVDKYLEFKTKMQMLENKKPNYNINDPQNK